MLAARPVPHPAPAFPGLYSGTVLATDDGYQTARIEVAVPSVFDGDDADAAVWARPCLPFGCFFVPEVGDRVWIAFENGDPAAPVWLGTWVPRDGAPATAAVTPPARRLVRSASGHEVLLDDTSGAEKVVVTHRGGSTIEISATELRLHAAADLVVEAPHGKITVSATAIELKAPSVDVLAS
jgi:uncharacterized protein involved in type VI secretion and phage assembly